MAKTIKAGAKNLLQWIWWYYIFIIAGISFILVFPVFRYLIAKPSRHANAYWLRHKLAKYFLIINRIRIKIEGDSSLLSNKPFILCSNHLSDIDVLVLLSAFRDHFAFMGKYELGEYPLFGQFFKTLDVAVDREDPSKASASYKKALKRLEEGQSLVIFPEGGIKDSRRALKPFKSGAFTMASKTGIPIQPITILDSGKVIHPFQAKGRPGTIIIKIHKPLLPREKTPDQLKSEVYSQINDGLE